MVRLFGNQHYRLQHSTNSIDRIPKHCKKTLGRSFKESHFFGNISIAYQFGTARFNSKQQFIEIAIKPTTRRLLHMQL